MDMDIPPPPPAPLLDTPSPTSVSKELLERKDGIKTVDIDEVDSPSALQILLQREENHYRSQCLQGFDILFKKEKDQYPAVLEWFISMTQWCHSAVDGCNLPSETVEVAMNILDRYLLATCQSIGPFLRQSISLKAHNIFGSSTRFKLIVLTCLYIASKAGSPGILTPDLLETLARKEIAAKDIEMMEMKIKSVVKFQFQSPTVVVLADEMEKQLQIWSREGNDEMQRSLFSQLVEKQARVAMAKLYPFQVSASSIALACVKNALLVMEAQSLLNTHYGSVSSSAFQKALRELEKEIQLSNATMMTQKRFLRVQERLQYKMRIIARQTAFAWKQQNREDDDMSINIEDCWASMSRLSSRSLTSIHEVSEDDS